MYICMIKSTVMKMKFLLLILLTINLTGFCQYQEPNIQSNKNIDFSRFLSGVKYAYLALNDNFVKDINYYDSQAISGVIDYLKDIGFEDVKSGSIKDMPQILSSFCDLVIVIISWNKEDNAFRNIKLAFVSCNNDRFLFEGARDITINDFNDIHDAFYTRCNSMYTRSKVYNSSQTLSLPVEMTEWTEQKLKKHFKENGANVFEGIYEGTISNSNLAKYKLGLIKSDTGYNLIYISGAKNYIDWTEGEIKSNLIPTSTATLFKAEWKMAIKAINKDAFISFEKGLMELIINGEKEVYIKLFPTAEDERNIRKKEPASGTGFGISSNGLIATNSHVINNVTKITVRGINSDFTKSYSAKLLIEDVKNDLAIIQINDSSFKSLETIPYTISYKSSDVGSSVFVLGYPLKAVMGDEIKLTNGIISSKSGFQGDVTSYQITAPIQPGNSGGPLFDSNGNLIGIVNAKLLGGENVSYAIKSSYLLNLIEILPTVPSLTIVNLLAGKLLPEQVKIINRFVYIIEVN
jgi:S1-C subfamily serine protease